jgi:hypothetical protein
VVLKGGILESSTVVGNCELFLRGCRLPFDCEFVNRVERQWRRDERGKLFARQLFTVGGKVFDDILY